MIQLCWQTDQSKSKLKKNEYVGTNWITHLSKKNENTIFAIQIHFPSSSLYFLFLNLSHARPNIHFPGISRIFHGKPIHVSTVFFHTNRVFMRGGYKKTHVLFEFFILTFKIIG